MKLPGSGPAWMRRDAAFLFVLLLAAFVRSIGLNRGLWLDEIANVGVLTRPAIAALFNVGITTARSPLFFALYRPWLVLAGDSAVAARWPALLCGVLSVALIWRVARAWAGPRAGYAAALLLALNPLHIWYSQEASFYTFVG
ncbi:MAG: glycosyltransferase family 39 protein, partial [Anaerolineae bacterium]